MHRHVPRRRLAVARIVAPAFALLAVFPVHAAPAFAVPFQARLTLPDERPAAGYVVSVVGQPATAVCDARRPLHARPRAARRRSRSSPRAPTASCRRLTRSRRCPTGPSSIVLPPVARDSVTVVSGVAPTLDTLPASAATVVTLEELEQRAPQRLYQALESVAGASKLGDGADSAPSLRGLARGRTLILLDGARVSAERRVGPSATFVEPESLSSVEVVRGPGSVAYGSDAFGGVINAVTRDPDLGAFGAALRRRGLRRRPRPAGRVPRRLGRRRAAATCSSKGTGAAADDAEAGDGVPIFNSALDSKGGAARYVHDVGPGRLRVSLAVDRMEDLGKAAIDSRVNTSTYPDESSDRFVASWLGTPGGQARRLGERRDVALLRQVPHPPRARPHPDRRCRAPHREHRHRRQGR